MTTTTAAAAAGTTQTAASTAGTKSLTSLAGNFNDFLKLLMTQLQNQDPTSPMDTNQFTSQLVQFTSVEQQINTNSSLTKLIQATQGDTLLQSSALVGQQVEVSGDQISLQNHTAALKVQAASAGPTTVTISSAAGVKLRDATFIATPGSNTWTWDGANTRGVALPDGAYKVAVVGPTGASVPFTVMATATGVQRTGDDLKVKLGQLQVDFSAIQSVANK